MILNELKEYCCFDNFFLKYIFLVELVVFFNKFVCYEVLVMCLFWNFVIRGVVGKGIKIKFEKVVNVLVLCLFVLVKFRNERMFVLVY